MGAGGRAGGAGDSPVLTPERVAFALEAAEVGVWEWDVDTSRVTWSPTLERLYGLTSGEFGGTFEHYAQLVHPEDRHWILASIRESVEHGTGHRVEHRVVWPDGTVRWIEGRGRVVRGEDGRVVGMAGTGVDITERKRIEQDRIALLERERRARRDAAFLSDVSRMLFTSSDEHVALGALAEMVVRHMADWCTINLMQRSGAIRRVVGRHADPERQRLVDELLDRYPHDPAANSGVANVIRTGEPLLMSDVGEDLLRSTAHGDEYFKLTRALGIRSCMILPLATRGPAFGAMSIVVSESQRLYGSDDLALASELASRAAAAVESIRLYKERDAVAQTLQRGLLPAEPTGLEWGEVASLYMPLGWGSLVGGDFYDAFQVQDGRWVFTIGDVCGKGPRMAALGALARHVIRAGLVGETAAREVLGRLNGVLLAEEPRPQLSTVALVVAERAGDRIEARVTLAGHPRPILLRGEGQVEWVGRYGTLLGFAPEIEVSEVPVSLRPGDTLVLYTDGLFHGGEGEDARQALGEDLARVAGSGAKEICRTIDLWLADSMSGRLRDDVAVLAVRVGTS